MKIGIVIDRYEPSRGGVEQWTHQYVSYLLRHRHEVHLLARSFDPKTADDGYIPHAVPAPQGRMAWGSEVESRLRRLPLDVIHDTGAAWHCHVFQPHGGSRTASFERNLMLEPKWRRPWKRRLAAWLPRYREFQQLSLKQYADDGRILLALSKMVARDFASYHRVSEKNIRIIYNGVDIERFSPSLRSLHRERLRAEWKIASGEIVFLIVAHNFALKGVAAAIQATALLNQQGMPVRLVVAGGGKAGPYRRLATELKITQRVLFLGQVGDASNLYSAADVYVQPTFYDPCSLVVLEALASGMPVITSAYNGAGELITPGVEGAIIADPADFRELAEVALPMCREDTRRVMGEAARRLAEQHPLERNFREILWLYEEIPSFGRVRAA